jgi:hypothetical protein
MSESSSAKIKTTKTRKYSSSLASIKKLVSNDLQLSKKKKKMLFAFFEFVMMEDDESQGSSVKAHKIRESKEEEVPPVDEAQEDSSDEKV